MAGRSLDITCTSCGADTLVKRVPKFEAFKKVGDAFVCVSCGFEYQTEEDVPFRTKRTVSVFGDSDRSKKLDIFTDDKNVRNCRRCKHYIVNPFSQRCGLTQKNVEATDVCFDFKPAEAEKPEAEKSQPPRKPALPDF